MIHDRRAYRKPAVEHRRRRRGDAGFLDVDHNLAVEPVGIIRAISEADDVEIDRREKLEPRFGENARLQMFGERTAASNDRTELVGAIGLQREPGLQRPEAARKVRTEVAGP